MILQEEGKLLVVLNEWMSNLSLLISCRFLSSPRPGPGAEFK